MLQTDVLVYGGDGGREVRPNFVAADWKVAAEFVKDYKGTVGLHPQLPAGRAGHPAPAQALTGRGLQDAYAPVKFTLSCADGTKVEKPSAPLPQLCSSCPGCWCLPVHELSAPGWAGLAAQAPCLAPLAADVYVMACSWAGLWQRASLHG